MTDDLIIIDVDETGMIEVALTDLDGTEYIYWVSLDDRPNDHDDDAYDWAIAVARTFHASLGLASVPEDEWTDDGELKSYAFASEPFSREPHEYTRVPPS